MKSPPITIEYICLTCGTQGLVQKQNSQSNKQILKGGNILKCPKCGANALVIKREAASIISLSFIH